MRHAVFVAGLLAAAVPALADTCPGPSAVIEGGFSLQGAYGYTCDQRMVLTRSGGSGIYGRWIGIEYVQTSHYAIELNPAPPELLAGVQSTMPGVRATCTGLMPDLHTVIAHCTGRFEYDVARDNTVRWAGQSQRVGHVVPASGSNPAQIYIDMLAGAPQAPPPGMDSGIIGDITPGPPFWITARITGHSRASGSGGVDYTDLTIAAQVVPAVAANANTLTMTATSTTASAVVAPLTPTTMSIRLFGSTRSRRQEAATEVTVQGEFTSGPCVTEQSWPLADLLHQAGIEP